MGITVGTVGGGERQGAPEHPLTVEAPQERAERLRERLTWAPGDVTYIPAPTPRRTPEPDARPQ